MLLVGPSVQWSKGRIDRYTILLVIPLCFGGLLPKKAWPTGSESPRTGSKGFKISFKGSETCSEGPKTGCSGPEAGFLGPSAVFLGPKKAGDRL